VIAVKLASTGWRMLQYYRRGEEYIRHGPPHVVLRVLIAPAIVVSTVAVFGTGVALLTLDRTHGTLVGLHKASFIVWVGAVAVDVVAHIRKLPRLLRTRVRGALLRVAVVGSARAGRSRRGRDLAGGGPTARSRDCDIRRRRAVARVTLQRSADPAGGPKSHAAQAVADTR
jgi:hypothetical protein